MAAKLGDLSLRGWMCPTPLTIRSTQKTDFRSRGAHDIDSCNQGIFDEIFIYISSTTIESTSICWDCPSFSSNSQLPKNGHLHLTTSSKPTSFDGQAMNWKDLIVLLMQNDRETRECKKYLK